MGLFDGLFKKKPKNTQFAPMINGVMPFYSYFGTNIYRSVVVQQALKCIVDEIKKLNPTHIRYKNSDPIPVEGDIQNVLNEPNDLMTTSEMLEKVTWLLLLNYNAFIIPTYRKWAEKRRDASGNIVTVERRYYEALYPILPSNVEILEDSAGRMFANFWFRNGQQTTIPYEDVIHLKYNYSVSDYMGGNMAGQPDHEPLLEMLELNHQLLQGIAKAMNASYSVNGIVKYNTMIDKGTQAQAIQEFNKLLSDSKSGILPLDLKAEYLPIKNDVKLVDTDLLKFIDSNILRTWGISTAILSGDYTPDQYNAFYQKTLEPLAKSFAQAFTKKLFTRREKSFGNRIEFYPKDLINMSPEQTIQLINTLAPQGGGFVNEYRAWLGLRPLPELVGKRYMSLNWIDANKANQYQVGEDNVEVIDEEKQDV